MPEGNDLLTTARCAVLDAIAHSPLLADATTSTGRAFNQVIDYEDQNYLIDDSYEPSISEFPALDVRWGGTATAVYDTNVMMQAVAQVELRIYTGGNYLPKPEQLAFRLIRAIHQARDAGAEDSYVAVATGFAPRLISFDPPKPTKIGRNKETLATLSIVRIGLMIQFDPESE